MSALLGVVVIRVCAGDAATRGNLARMTEPARARQRVFRVVSGRPVRRMYRNAGIRLHVTSKNVRIRHPARCRGAPLVSRCPWGASTCVGGGDCGDDVLRRRPASGDAFGRLPRHVDAHPFDRPQRLGRCRRADRGHLAAQRFRRGTPRRGRTRPRQEPRCGSGHVGVAGAGRRCRRRTRSSSSSTTVATRGCGPATSPRATHGSRAGSPSSSSSSRRPRPAAATSRVCPAGAARATVLSYASPAPRRGGDPGARARRRAGAGPPRRRRPR